MISVTFHLGPELHEAVSVQDHKKDILGRGTSQHKGTEAGKNVLCSLKTSRGPVSKKSGRRYGGGNEGWNHLGSSRLRWASQRSLCLTGLCLGPVGECEWKAKEAI